MPSESLTKDQFLADPSRAWFADQGPFPADWIREAWSSDEFRSEVTYELARSVSKSGGFGLARRWILDVLSQVLTETDTANLYLQIREESERDPTEWRPDFEAKFGELAIALPDPTEDMKWWESGA